MSKFELGGVLHGRIREKMEYENPPVSEFAPPKGAYEKALPDVLSATSYMKHWLNGIFFMLFMVLTGCERVQHLATRQTNLNQV